MADGFLAGIKPFSDFAGVTSPAHYRPLPDDWLVGISDVVDSRSAIAAGRYKAVNLAGAAVISAVTNALDGRRIAFVFGGDGTQFAIEPADREPVADAMRRTARWAEDALSLTLRVALVPVADIRAAGRDVRVARYSASPAVDFAMFSGGGMEWAEAQVKAGAWLLDPGDHVPAPDLSGLSCQWNPLKAQNGVILTLIAKPADAASETRFTKVVDEVLTLLDGERRINPVPEQGPEVRWPSGSIGLQSRASNPGASPWQRTARALLQASLAWVLFKTGLRAGRFHPGRYRRQVALNTDYRKYDDGLMLTVDCRLETADTIEAVLERAAGDGTVVYGCHRQDSALMTCFVPSVVTDTHLHFVDGAGGGYAEAARRLKERSRPEA